MALGKKPFFSFLAAPKSIANRFDTAPSLHSIWPLPDTLPGFMRFNPELMRKILIAVESMLAGEPVDGTICCDSSPQSEVSWNTQMIIDERYIYGSPSKIIMACC